MLPSWLGAVMLSVLAACISMEVTCIAASFHYALLVFVQLFLLLAVENVYMHVGGYGCPGGASGWLAMQREV